MTGTLHRLRSSASLVLALLLIAYIFNYLDRQILGILAGPIIGDLHLNDRQFGALSGPPFAILYSVLGIPFAYLADRTGRSRVIAGAVAFWSAFTALCGTAASFWQFFIFRMGVGIGEAGGVAPSYALIADYFEPRRRARALAVFSLGVPIGLALGTLLGAYIAHAISWRAAFFTMGIAGVLLAPVLVLVVRDPPRAKAPDAAPIGQVFPMLARKPVFWLIAFAASSSSLCGYGLATWTPSVLERSFHLGLIERGEFMASVVFIGGCVGVFAGGWLADRFGTVDRGWYARLPAIAWLITAPTFAAGLMAPSLWLAWPLLLIPNALNIFWLGPVITAVQHLVPQRMRSTASASFLLINNLIGLGVGPYLIGSVSESLKKSYGAEALRYAAVGSTVFYLLASFLMFLCVSRLRSSWLDDHLPKPA
ncbi:spinster family MFS transporter [Sphingomonas agri]|uniref:spinster family MFS transporter n=1 Tax=Sphingomonas agri TaxID=1813878 RepID=UPI00311F69C1